MATSVRRACSGLPALTHCPEQAAGLFPKSLGFRQSWLPKPLACPAEPCHGPCETVLINTLGHAKSCETTADVLGLQGVPA